MNPYEELNIPKDATQAEIKAAFHESAKKNHPDKKGDSEKMKRINMSYMILKDPERRKRYDKYGDEGRVNNDDTMVVQIFCDIIKEIIDRSPNNIKEAIEKLKIEWQREYTNKRIQVSSQKGKIEKFKKRIRKKPKKMNDVLNNYLNGRIDDIDDQLKAMERGLNLRLKALDIFDRYEFEDFEEITMFSIAMSGTASSSASTTW